MKKEFSIYLDLVRFGAALLVVIFHSNIRLLTTEVLPYSDHGYVHAAVIVFFVLSGYVISYVAQAKESTPLEYWSSRLSRFYSLAIPVVLLCPLLDMWGEALGPQFYVGATTHDFALVRMLTSLTYLNEIWSVSIASFSNTPYWSLCYEMWYYVLFAIITFTRSKTRVALTSATLLLLGPKILVLAPIWVLGVVLHRSESLRKMPEWMGWLLFLSSWPLYALFEHFGLTNYGSDLLLRWIGPEWHRQMVFSKFFLTDYPLALIIAANFVGFRAIAHRFAPVLLRCEKPIRWVAGYTFSLYILHQPLLQFFAAAIHGDPGGRLFYTEVIACVALSVIAISSVTEQKRHLLRAAIRRVLGAATASDWWRHSITSNISSVRAGG